MLKDAMELIVPFLPVPMTVLVWEHVILQQEPAHAMLDAMEMIALLFVQMTVLEWEHVLSKVTLYPFCYARIFSLSNYIS